MNEKDKLITILHSFNPAILSDGAGVMFMDDTLTFVPQKALYQMLSDIAPDFEVEYAQIKVTSEQLLETLQVLKPTYSYHTQKQDNEEHCFLNVHFSKVTDKDAKMIDIIVAKSLLRGYQTTKSSPTKYYNMDTWKKLAKPVTAAMKKAL